VKSRQSGITLVVSLIMLMVLTLLVVSAVRFGNINLKISGNAQTEAEATAATQVAIEQTLQQVLAADKIDSILAQPALAVSTGGMSYNVNVAKPTCVLTKNIKNVELDPTKNDDRLCFGTSDPDSLVGSDGKLLAAPTSCKGQQWDIAATTGDPLTGAQVSMLQGVSLRVSAEVQCP
jgi:hypothetical protein